MHANTLSESIQKYFDIDITLKESKDILPASQPMTDKEDSGIYS